MKNKKGQFFLLAAVIISLVIFSLGATTNKAIVRSDDFRNIEDFSYQVEREIGEVLNYVVYTEITVEEETGEEDENLVEEFAQLVAEDILDENPNAEFIFIFGNEDNLTVSNYGEETIEVIAEEIEDSIYCGYFDNELLDQQFNRAKRCRKQSNNCMACPSNPDGCNIYPYMNNPLCSLVLSVQGSNLYELEDIVYCAYEIRNGVDELNEDIDNCELLSAANIDCKACASTCSETLDERCIDSSDISEENYVGMICDDNGETCTGITQNSIDAMEQEGIISYQGSSQSIEDDTVEPETLEMSQNDLGGTDEISVIIDDIDVQVPVTEHDSVTVIIKEETDEETFVSS